jgi:hydroxymethylglutaryl-CoA lyase
MLEAMGYRTGVDLDVLLDLARRMPDIVGHDVPGQVMKAGPFSRRYPVPRFSGSPADRQSVMPCAANREGGM